MTSRLTTILETGILSGKTLQQKRLSFSPSFDQELNPHVFFNIVTHPKGISKAICDPFRGAYSIGVEKQQDGDWIRKFLFRRPLSCHPEFLSEISARIRKIAIFILALDDWMDEPFKQRTAYRYRGCQEQTRACIPAIKIKAIILSKKYEQLPEIQAIVESEQIEVLFVSDISTTISYSYLGKNGLETVSNISVQAPDFATTLAHYSKKSGFPLFLHTSRL